MHPSFVSLGPLHIPLSGLCAALGLMAGLSLTQVTACRARLHPQAVWDAALTLVLSAFLISRVLLVAGNWRSFLASPWPALSLASLNDSDILLTALFMMVYLRRRGLSVLGFLDAMAPCAALMWAFLSLGDLLDGTRNGMPRAGRRSAHPVEAYTTLAAVLLCGVLLRVLSGRRIAGHVFALGLEFAGVALFLLDFLRIPSELFAAAILDPVQWLGLAMLVVGCSLSIALPELPSYVAQPAPEIGTTHAL